MSHGPDEDQTRIRRSGKDQVRTGWTYLQLLLIHLHLLLLVPHNLGVPASVIPLGVVELGVAKASLELPEGVTQLKDRNRRLSGPAATTFYQQE